MNTEIIKPMRCVVIRAGQEIWIDEDRVQKLTAILDSEGRFIEIDGELINKADVVGIFTPDRMEETARRKNGQWKCDSGRWHERLEKCTHKGKEYEDKQDIFQEKIKECGKCKGGYQVINGANTTLLCPCVKDFV